MAFLLGLFLGELIFGGAYYWKEFCVSKWVGLGNQNKVKLRKQPKTVRGRLYSGGLIIGRIFSSEIFFFFWWGGGVIFGRAYFFVGGGGGGWGLIIGILRYFPASFWENVASFQILFCPLRSQKQPVLHKQTTIEFIQDTDIGICVVSFRDFSKT